MRTFVAAATATAWVAALLKLTDRANTMPLGVLIIALTVLPFAWTEVQLIVHRRTARREEALRLEREGRARSWLAHAWELGPLPPLDTASRDALAELVEVMTGEAALALRDLYVKRGLLQEDILEVASRDRATRLAAIARLARVRHQAGLRPLLAAATSKDGQTAREALQAMARTVAFSRPGKAIDQLITAMCAARLNPAEVEILISLTRDRAEPVAMRLLTAADGRYALATVRAIGRLRLLGLADTLGGFLREGAGPAMRAAALRALKELARVPEGRERELADALLSRDPDVVIAAARLSTVIPDRVRPPLLHAINGADQHARRRAITALGAQGAVGKELGAALLPVTASPARPGSRPTRPAQSRA